MCGSIEPETVDGGVFPQLMTTAGADKHPEPLQSHLTDPVPLQTEARCWRMFAGCLLNVGDVSDSSGVVFCCLLKEDSVV